MFTGMEMIACPNLAVSATVMQHIVNVESGANPYAIGVVGGQLVRQPKTLGEALATVHMLDAQGYGYSLGVAQVNRANLGKYGLDSYEKAFDACANLSAGSRILAGCYTSAKGDWGKSFSCYYSGNFVTGYRDGYVARVYASISRSARAARVAGVPAAVSLRSVSRPADGPATTSSNVVVGSADYRKAIRSVAFDSAATAAPPVTTSAVAAAGPGQPTSTAAATETLVPATTTTSMPPAAAAPPSGSSLTVFEPQVRGPNDPATGVAQSAAPPANVGTSSDRNAIKEPGDAAFVF